MSDPHSAGVVELQQFGRQLLAAKKPQAALEVFQFNYNKNPNQFTTLVRMARELAPNDSGNQAVQSMIEKLMAGDPTRRHLRAAADPAAPSLYRT